MSMTKLEKVAKVLGELRVPETQLIIVVDQCTLDEFDSAMRGSVHYEAEELSEDEFEVSITINEEEE